MHLSQFDEFLLVATGVLCLGYLAVCAIGLLLVIVDEIRNLIEKFR